MVAAWGAPLPGLLAELPGLRETCLLVSLSGAAGTASALGDQAADLRADLAAALGLQDPGRSWHTDRAPVLRLADWMTRVSLALAKIGADATALVQSGIEELTLGGTGASSTMPQKQNPVAPSVLSALARQGAGLNAVLQGGAGVHQHQRDGAAWFTEWMCLPQVVLGAACAARAGSALCSGLAPNTGAMAEGLTQGLGLIHAEALTFTLAGQMPRPEAQAAVKDLCKEAQSTRTPLKALVERDYPAMDASALFDPAQQLGNAPLEALAFSKMADGLNKS